MASSTGAGPAIALAAEDTRFEYREVSSSERKAGETQRETDPSVVTAVQQFFQLVAQYYTPEDAPQYGDALYGAMNSAGSAMPGLGPADTYPFPRLQSVTSAQSFYTYNVSQQWKELTGNRLGAPWNSPEVFAAWKDAVTNGQDMDEDMLDLGSTALGTYHWLSPDERMLQPTSSTREQGNSDFFLMCHVVSLAPEWYPDGLVRLNPSPIPSCTRPVSFDGMTSPLWVQQPPDLHAATGGGALETLNQPVVPLSICTPLESYIVTDEMTQALKSSPSVNLYAVDLALVANGGSPANDLLGQEQRSIVVQVRNARTEADRGFEKTAKSEPAVLTAAARPSSEVRAMPSDAQPRIRSYASLADLKAQMAAWAKAGQVEHRGQRFPSERFEREAGESPQRAAEIVKAAAELLAESDDARVIRMVAQLGANTDYAPYYEAVLRRLAASVPEVPGIRSRTLREDLLKRLTEQLPATDANLAARAHAILKSERRPDLRLAMLNQYDPAGEIMDTLAEVCQGEASPWLVARTAAVLARRHPQLLLRAASAASRQKEKTRHLFYEEVRRAAPDWFAQNGLQLRDRLGTE